jgi:hypothetical protein
MVPVHLAPKQKRSSGQQQKTQQGEPIEFTRNIKTLFWIRQPAARTEGTDGWNPAGKGCPWHYADRRGEIPVLSGSSADA